MPQFIYNIKTGHWWCGTSTLIEVVRISLLIQARVSQQHLAHTLAACIVEALKASIHTVIFLSVRAWWVVYRDLVERFPPSWETYQTWKASQPESGKAHGERGTLAQGGKGLLALEEGENYFPVSSFPLWKATATNLQIFTPSGERNMKMVCLLTHLYFKKGPT